MSRLTRRQALGAGGAAAGALALGAAGARVASDGDAGADATVAFHGEHQAGIATPAQDRLMFGSFDVTAEDRRELRDLLREWSYAAAAMTAGERAGPEPASPLAPPFDTGEAAGLSPARLTITLGLGPTLFERRGEDRFGLAARRPAALEALPALPGDELDPERSGGDLCVQACADDPQVAFHAVRNLARIGRGAVTLRWSQIGFGRTSSTSRKQATPRNLMGFKDGTNNIKAEDGAAMRRHVWSGPEGPDWMRGGSLMVTRRIRMLIEVWDRASLDDQEKTIGRVKGSGAPLGHHDEFEAVDLRARGADGQPRVPADAHVRLAAPASNGGERILRRGYSFTDGFDPRLGQLDAGLFFICFQRDPRRQFAAIQRNLGADALNEYIVHTSSAVFACPPGARRGGYVGASLF
jgi:deferrochelatase/peroxidase EfeB